MRLLFRRRSSPAPRALGWTILGDPSQAARSWSIAPTADRIAVVSASTLQVRELASGRVLHEQPSRPVIGHARTQCDHVRWIDRDHLLLASTRGRFEVELVDASSGARLAHWSGDEASVRIAQVEHSADGSRSVWIARTAGAPDMLAGLYVVDANLHSGGYRGGALAPLRVSRVQVPPAGALPGYSAYRSTTLQLEPETGACLVIDDPKHGRAPVVSLIAAGGDVAVPLPDLVRPPPSHTLQSVRWIAPNLVLARHTFVDARTPSVLWSVHDLAAGACVEQLQAPDFGHGRSRDRHQALESLEDSVRADAGRRYGCASTGVVGEPYYGWTTRVDDATLAATRGAEWEHRPFSVVWAGGSVLATFRHSTGSIHRRADPDGDLVELGLPDQSAYPRTLRVCGGDRWLAASTREGVAIVPISELPGA